MNLWKADRHVVTPPPEMPPGATWRLEPELYFSSMTRTMMLPTVAGVRAMDAARPVLLLAVAMEPTVEIATGTPMGKVLSLSRPESDRPRPDVDQVHSQKYIVRSDDPGVDGPALDVDPGLHPAPDEGIRSEHVAHPALIGGRGQCVDRDRRGAPLEVVVGDLHPAA